MYSRALNTAGVRDADPLSSWNLSFSQSFTSTVLCPWTTVDRVVLYVVLTREKNLFVNGPVQFKFMFKAQLYVPRKWKQGITDVHTCMFTSALNTIVKTLKEPSLHQWWVYRKVFPTYTRCFQPLDTHRKIPAFAAAWTGFQALC